MKSFKNYTLQVTEGPQTQEILVGIKNKFSTFITQKVEFKAGVTAMRPGQLVTLETDGVFYTLLFLHLSSGTNPRNMGLRNNMLHKAIKFRKHLDKVAGGKNKSNYIFLGVFLNLFLFYFAFYLLRTLDAIRLYLILLPISD